jgi:hypothetical protein
VTSPVSLILELMKKARMSMTSPARRMVPGITERPPLRAVSTLPRSSGENLFSLTHSAMSSGRCLPPEGTSTHEGRSQGLMGTGRNFLLTASMLMKTRFMESAARRARPQAPSNKKTVHAAKGSSREAKER